MGCCRHQQEMTCESTGQRAQLKALGVLDFLAEKTRRHTVRFVADDEVPLGRRFELRLEFVVARQHVESGDEPWVFGERVAGNGSFYLLASHDRECEVELVYEFVLPLLNQASRRDDEATFEAAPDQ